MRSKLGVVVLGLGVFLLLVGALARFYAYPKVAVVPLDQVSAPPSAEIPDPENPPTVSIATGATIFSLAEGATEITTDLVSTRVTLGRVDEAEALSDATGEDLAVYDTFSYTRDGEDRILSGVFDRVAFDRNTGEVYSCSDEDTELCDAKTASVKADATETDIDGTFDDLQFIYPGDEEGLFEGFEGFQGFEGQYFKMPFNAQQQTYLWWDGDLRAATEATFEGEEDLEGLTVYKYVQVIEPTKVGEQVLPADIAGVDAEGDITTDSMYSNTRTLWIEPETGVLIKGQEEQHNYFAYEGEEVVTTTLANIGYDDATVSDNVDTYQPLAFQLKLLRVWVPLVGLVLGLILTGLGVVMVVRGRRSGPDGTTGPDTSTA